MKDYRGFRLSRCRKQLVFLEQYFRYNNQEFVLLLLSSMYPYGLDSTSPTDIAKVLDYIKNSDELGAQQSGVSLEILAKEGGVWKYVEPSAIAKFFGSTFGTFDFAFIGKKPKINIESRIDASGTRVYVKI